jgi:hypothetical protein
MSMAVMKRKPLAVVGGLVGLLAASYLLGLDLLQSGLLVVGAGLAGGVAAGGIALSYLLGSPQPFCEGIVPYRGCLTTYGWASAVFLGSSLGVAIAAGHLGRYRRLRNASLEPVAAVEEGPVAVEGRVVSIGDAVTGPVSGEPVAWYRRAVESATPVGGYREVDAETCDRDLYVADGSGRLLVLAAGLDAHDVAELARSHTAADGEQRRREWSYQPDDAVTVVGVASDVSRAEYPEPVVVGLDEPVIVGRRTLPELRSWAAQRAVLGSVIALMTGGGSLLVLLTV